MDAANGIAFRRKRAAGLWSALVLAAVAGVSCPAFAQQTAATQQQDYVSPDPYTSKPGTWIVLSGTVEAVGADAFRLDYGVDTILVHMRPVGRKPTRYKLVKGEKVVVAGIVDDSFIRSRTISASTVYLRSRNEYIYGSPADAPADLGRVPPGDGETIIIRGKVTAVGSDEFTLNTGTLAVRVDVRKLAENPLEAGGSQRVVVGDIVAVTGANENALLGGQKFEADSLEVLRPDQG